MSNATHRARVAELEAERAVLLDVINAILLAHGNGPDGRMRVVNAYVGKVRRPVVTEPVTDGFIIYLDPDTRPDPLKED